jgi:muramoyltetrapeptide carboxypeptidase LdcA involved in peptidoglycan recycling
MIKPPKLNPGDRVAAVSTSWGGPATIPARYEAGKRQFEEAFSVQVVEMPHTLKSADWLDAHPQARAQDLMDAFRDPSIRAIVATIGGDESVRLLPYLDLEVIRRNPKIVLGYSDTTVTHFACLKAGLVSFYGPSVMAGLAENGGILPYMERSLRRTLCQTETIGEIAANPDGWTVEHLDWADPALQTRKRMLNPAAPWKLLQGQGTARGHLIGGCVEVMEFLKGTDFWPSLDQWRGALLFLETSEEAPATSHFERWLRNYGSQGILQVISGILLGRPGGQLSESRFSAYDNALVKVVTHELGLRHLPVLTHMDFGHTDPFFTIPYGVQAELRCDTRSLYIAEAAVSD